MTTFSKFSPTAMTLDTLGRVVWADWRLAFAPPALVNPKDVFMDSNQRRVYFLDPQQDYRVHLPADHAVNPQDGDCEIIGGGNIVLIGGEIRYQFPNPASTQRGLLIKGDRNRVGPRTVHIEGLLLGGQLNEGIDIDSNGEKGLTVQLGNIKVDSPIQGSYSTNHADGLQCWNGPHRLLIDGFSAPYCDYQGMMLQPAQYGYLVKQADGTWVRVPWAAGDFGQWKFRRVYMANTGAYVIYDNCSPSSSVPVDIQAEDVWLNPGAAADGTPQPWRAVYPQASPLAGQVNIGVAPEDPCPNSGRGYVSPGYLVSA